MIDEKPQGEEDEFWEPEQHDQTNSNWRFSRLAQKVYSFLLVGLIALYLTNSTISELPSLTTAFPYVAGVAFIVLFVAVGMDTGILPTAGADEGGEL